MFYFKQSLLPLFCLFLLTLGCKKEQTTTTISNSALDTEIDELLNLASNNQGRAYFTLPESDDYLKIPNDPNNPITEEKVVLGKLLYHETGLAINPKNPISKNTYSCASCHFASAGFQAGRFQGIAEGGIGFGINGEGRMRGSLYEGDSLDVQPIRSPTTLHVAYQKVMLWNGQFGATGLNANTDDAWVYGTPIETNYLGFEGTETQAIAGLKIHRMGMEENFLTTYGYKPLFNAAFPTIPEEERYNSEQAGLAIAAYERTLLANQSPFQKWLKGDDNAMTQTEKEGAILFFGKAECVNCHTGPALNKMDFSALGMMDLVQVSHESFKISMTDKERLGRAGFTGKAKDMYKFKIPQLYNLKDSPFYGHGSSLYTIRDVVSYKNEAIKENAAVPDANLDPDFKPLGLTNAEVLLITDFIKNGLYDNNLNRYIPERVLSGYCFPFNDPLAKNQMGCD
ncbi:MAG: cytochrome-c peroxidase [Saprospiraceae bacterium]